jgi:hypothetical protein
MVRVVRREKKKEDPIEYPVYPQKSSAPSVVPKPVGLPAEPFQKGSNEDAVNKTKHNFLRYSFHLLGTCDVKK